MRTSQHRLAFLVVLALASIVTGCGKSPSTPSDTTLPPKITCPVAPAPAVSPDDISALVSYGDPTVANGATPFLTNCTPVSGFLFPVGTTAVTCRTTDGLKRTDSCTFNVVVTLAPRISLVRFVAFGDSITAGEDGTAITAFSTYDSVPESLWPRVILPIGDRYPTQLESSLRSRYIVQGNTIVVSNQGRVGETVAQGLSRFSSTITGYDAVLLMEGANDLGGDLSIPINGLRQMVETAKARGVRVFLGTLPPEAVHLPDAPPRGQPLPASQLNDQIRSLALIEGVTLVDVERGFPSGDLIGLGLIGHDGLHPTASGYSLIASTFFQSIKSALEVVR